MSIQRIKSGVIADSAVTAAKLDDSTSQLFGFRNRIINGDMRIAQRGTGAFTAAGNFPIDRFSVGNPSDGAFSAQQDSSAPVGFTNSVKITITTADTNLTTTQQFNISQSIEGTNIADLGWGTANAKTVTLSFWVRSSLTGTFGGALRNSALNRSYPFSYSISAADTWEYKTVTIPGDTTGTWLTTNGIGIGVFFTLGAGPDRSGTAGAWSATANTSVTGAVSVVGTLNATWFITGVQLEVGSVATPFERRPFGTELALCQRYFQQSNMNLAWGLTSSTALYSWRAFVPMRTAPSIAIAGSGSYSSTTVYYESTPWTAAGTLTGASAETSHISRFGGDIRISGTYSGSLTANKVIVLFTTATPTTGEADQSYLNLSSEL